MCEERKEEILGYATMEKGIQHPKTENI